MSKEETNTSEVKAVSLDQIAKKRNSVIVKTSTVGIIANLFLVILKGIIGLVTHSIAVTLDAINNLSDAVSSVVTIIGSKLAIMKPTKKHPMGFGRMEYMSAITVAGMVVYAGISAAIEAIRKIIHPVEANYTTISLVIIGVAVLVKIILGSYVKSKGRQVNSQALVASGSDALFDAILSFSVFASALIYTIFGLPLEPFVGLLISAFIVRTGIEMILDTINDILGRRVDPKISHQIKDIACQQDDVFGAYDLFLTNYGPGRDYASIHVELPDTMTVQEADVITRHIQHEVFVNTGVILTGVGIYSHNTQDNEAANILNEVRKIVLSNDWAIQMHGFYVNIPDKLMRFDVVFSFDIDASKGQGIVLEQVQKAYPDYRIIIAADLDMG